MRVGSKKEARAGSGVCFIARAGVVVVRRTGWSVDSEPTKCTRIV